MTCIFKTVESHAASMKSKMEYGKVHDGDFILNHMQELDDIELPSPISTSRHTRMASNNQSNDQDDSGFDTSDSSDEKKKQ